MPGLELDDTGAGELPAAGAVAGAVTMFAGPVHLTGSVKIALK
jgi:hypothetical protein